MNKEKDFLNSIIGRLDAMLEYGESFKVDRPLLISLTNLIKDVKNRLDEVV